MTKRIYYILSFFIAQLSLFVLTGCSTTSNLPEDEVLYTGIKSIDVHDKTGSYSESVVLDEVNAALAYAPNASLMGSSFVRSPLPIGLWIYNAYADNHSSVFKKWLFNSFGSTPITISHVSPLTRTKVATNLLQNYGYFNGWVDYNIVKQRNPRKQKISYDIHLGDAYLFDSISYSFPAIEDSIIRATQSESLIKEGGQFSTFDLTNEKTRLVDAFHDNGFYYYRPDYINFLADTVNHPKYVSLRVEQDKETPARAQRQYYIGNVSAYIRKSTSLTSARSTTVRRDSTMTRNDSSATHGTQTLAPSLRPSAGSGRGVQYTDSLVLSDLKIVYQGDRMPIKPRVMFKNFKFWKGRMFNQSKVNQTITNLHNMNIFSSVRMTFTPRNNNTLNDSLSSINSPLYSLHTLPSDTLDVRLDATLDKLIETELDFNITQKSNSQVGPHLGLTFSKRNAFHHGETLSVGLKTSYEWQTLTQYTPSVDEDTESKRRVDSYEAGIKASISYPWIAFPWLNKKVYRMPTSSVFSLEVDHIRRSSYFRTISSEIEAKYGFQTGNSWSHEFVPISAAYRNLLDISTEMEVLINTNSFIKASMQEQLIPAMRYTLAYDNSWKPGKRNTTHFELYVKEASNFLNLVNSALGFDYNQQNKKLLQTPYSQFLKVQATLKNHFRLTKSTEIATRLQAGMVWSYGNSYAAPYSEMYYVGGANSIRAFAARSIGPGRFRDHMGIGSYFYQTGDFKLEANAEYRFPIAGSLNGALFVDAGNVWIMHPEPNDDSLTESPFFGEGLTLKDLPKEIALGTGFGLRYDLQFLVLRLDCGIAIHAPYATRKTGYYNIPKFSDGLGIHFAVGYPF